MGNLKPFRRIWKILKITKVDKIFTGFILFILGISFVIRMVEPQIETYGDAVWYLFSVITTIGFGDYYAVTVVGRICTIIVGIYALFVVALIPGVVVSYYMDVMQAKSDEAISRFLEKLEHLEDLSKEELCEISEKVKKIK